MKALLKFVPRMADAPLIAEVILETGAKMNIIRGSVDVGGGGEVMVEIPDERVNDVVSSFRSRGVEVTLLERPIEIDWERCIHCGACTSICHVGVFSLDKEGKLVMNAGKCVQCGVCVYSCPTLALRIVK